MKQPFFSRLTDRACRSDSLLCVGLDPHPDLLDRPTAGAARDFCLRLIDACAPYACAFKPNRAFFEALGPEGLAALVEVIAAVPDSIPVILDAKRGDIASTADAYARAAFDVLGADALTASPYLGRDSLEPFLVRPERGVFVLCKTSNPGADEFQSLLVAGGEPVYVRVARQVQEWRAAYGYDNVGLVVGATDPQALLEVRAVAPDLWILVPGVGAQGGDLIEVLDAGLRADRLGVLVTVSRSIAGAGDPAAAAADLRQAINRLRDRRQRGIAASPEWESAPGAGKADSQIAAALLESGCVRFGDFTLKSGRQSPIYVDMRRLASHPRALRDVASALMPLLRTLEFERLAAIPYAALPIGTALALSGDWPLIYPRREVKSHGTGSLVEGTFQPGDTAVVVDDLITTGESKLEVIEKLESVGLTVRDIVVLIDREQGASEVMAAAGYRLHAVTTLRKLLVHWRGLGALTADQVERVTGYLDSEL
jgi:uridine monophosphate synthetase